MRRLLPALLLATVVLPSAGRALADEVVPHAPEQPAPSAPALAPEATPETTPEAMPEVTAPDLGLPTMPTRSLPHPPVASHAPAAAVPAADAPAVSAIDAAPAVPAGPMSFEDLVAQIDSWMPLIVTATERLMSARAEPAGLVLTSEVTGKDAANYDAAVARIAHQTLTCDLLMTRMVLDAGVGVSYRLVKADGSTLDTIAFTATDCARR